MVISHFHQSHLDMLDSILTLSGLSFTRLLSSTSLCSSDLLANYLFFCRSVCQKRLFLIAVRTHSPLLSSRHVIFFILFRSCARSFQFQFVVIFTSRKSTNAFPLYAMSISSLLPIEFMCAKVYYSRDVRIRLSTVVAVRCFAAAMKIIIFNNRHGEKIERHKLMLPAREGEKLRGRRAEKKLPTNSKVNQVK